MATEQFLQFTASHLDCFFDARLSSVICSGMRGFICCTYAT